MGEKLPWETFDVLAYFFPPANWKKPPLLCIRGRTTWLVHGNLHYFGDVHLWLPTATLLRFSPGVLTQHSGGLHHLPAATVAQCRGTLSEGRGSLMQ